MDMEDIEDKLSIFVGDIGGIEPSAGYILVELDVSYSKIRGCGGLLELEYNEYFELWDSVEHRSLSGVVVSLPRGDIYRGLYYDRSIELSVGDRVWFDYRANSIDRRVIRSSGNVYLLIDYQWCYVSRGIGGVRVLNGYSLIDANSSGRSLLIKDVLSGEELDISVLGDIKIGNLPIGSYLGGVVGKDIDEQVGRLCYIGGIIERYKADPDFRDSYYYDSRYKLEVGMDIIIDYSYNIKLENGCHLYFDDGKEYYRVLRKDMLGVYLGGGRTNMYLFGNRCLIKLDRVSCECGGIHLVNVEKSHSGVVVVGDEGTDREYKQLYVGDRVLLRKGYFARYKFEEGGDEYIICEVTDTVKVIE